mgnify:CR=1 FL=1
MHNMERCTKAGDCMLSKDIQQWNLERQIQQLASVVPEGEVSQTLLTHKGKYPNAAAMAAACRVYYLCRCVYRSGFLLRGNVPGLMDLVYLYRGRLALSYEGSVMQVDAGNLILLQHSDRAVLTQDDAQQAELLLIRCTGELAENFYRMISKQVGIVQSVPEHTVHSAAESLLYYMKHPADAANTRLALIMTEFFSQILLDAMDRSAPKHPDWFVSAVDYLDQNYRNEITVQQLAKHLKISTPHLHRLFLEHTGQSPYQYILELRIQKAKELLADPILQIKYISKEVGFNHANHFIHHFKRITGVTPGQYRAGKFDKS